VRAGMQRIRVVPNPFILSGAAGEHVLFTNMPARGRLRIFSLAGQFLNEINWQEGDLSRSAAGAQSGIQGDLVYDLRTHETLPIASGLYLYVVDALDGEGRTVGRRTGKFVVVR
jgi:hypothetical protein